MTVKSQKSLFETRRFIFFAAVFAGLLTSIQAFAACEQPGSQTVWIEQTLSVWKKTRRSALKLRDEKLPWLVLFDETCVYHINPERGVIEMDSAKKIPFDRKFGAAYVANHDGKITLPNRQEVPAQLLSFASVYDGGRKAFFVSAMPAVWQKMPNLKTEKNLDALVKSVFVHEMTHTLHRDFFARLDEIEKRLPAVKNLDDDIIQNTFGQRDAFRAAFETEHELLYRAVGEPKLSRKRELAKEILVLIKARREKFFAGNESVYAELEEIFLTMEGAANWTAYRAATAQGLPRADALKLIRRGGKYWSQDEGLALFLLIDALLPNWQKKAFGKSAATVTDLLTEAVR